MKPTAIYGRVSTARQEDEQTIKTQLSAIDDFVQKGSFSVVERYLDEGWSGDVLARPALDRLRQDAKAKLWEAVIIYDPDRIARRYSYQELVMDELREAGIEVIFVTVSAPKNSEEKILYGVRGLFAEYERAKIGERFRLGKLRKIREGHILVSEAPYGWNYVPKQGDTPGYYVINEIEARVVRMMFDWIDREGLTLRGLVRRLQAMEIHPRKSKRGVWATSTLSHLLRNRAYIGEARWGSSYAVVPEKPTRTEKYRKNRKSSRRVRPQSEWLTVPVPPIVDQAVFARVRDRLTTNFLLSHRNTKNPYLLTGKIHCTCGRKRGGEGPQNGKHLYYRCLDRVLSFPLPATCKERGINARIADQLVWNGVTNLMTDPELMRTQVRRWTKAEQIRATPSDADARLLQTEIGKLKEQEDRFNRAYGSGLLRLEQLKEYTMPIRDKVTTLENQLASLARIKRETKPTQLPEGKDMDAFAAKAKSALQNLSFEARKSIIRNILDKAVGTKERLTVYGFIPLENINVCTSDRYPQSTPRHDNADAKIVPFRFQVNLETLKITHDMGDPLTEK